MGTLPIARNSPRPDDQTPLLLRTSEGTAGGGSAAASNRPLRKHSPLSSSSSSAEEGGGGGGGGGSFTADGLLLPPPPDRLLWLKLLLVSVKMLSCSTGIIVVNRFILVDLKWPYPMTVSTLGVTFSGLAGLVACDVLHLAPPVDMSTREYAFKVLPVGAISAVALWLGNSLCLHLTIAFIEMCRSLLPLFILTSSFIVGLETPTRAAVYAVLLTGAGCMVAAYGEVRISALGVALLVLNFIAEAARLLIMQAFLVGQSWHPLQGLKLLSPAVGLSLALGAFFTELPVMRQREALATPWENAPLFVLAASLGLCVSLLSLVVIKLSGATTLKVLAAVRGPLVVTLGVLLFAEQVTLIEILGYAVALAGFVWYSYEKSGVKL